MSAAKLSWTAPVTVTINGTVTDSVAFKAFGATPKHDRYAHINDGDLVRVERQGTENAWEGRAYRPFPSSRHLINIGGTTINGNWDDDTAANWVVAVLEAALPPEPPIGSVVLDANGIPWSRTDSGGTWQSAIGYSYQWKMLVEAHGPVRGMRTTGDAS